MSVYVGVSVYVSVYACAYLLISKFSQTVHRISGEIELHNSFVYGPGFITGLALKSA